MKVSVIIAAYNIEEYIDKCLKSVIDQTLRDIEIIVVDDGSTDNTMKYIQKNSKKDNRIKIISKKNAGSIEARKTGLENATGEYILFVDGDDWLELNTLEILYNNAHSSTSDIVIFNCFKSYDAIQRNIIYKMWDYGIEKSKDFTKMFFLGKIRPSIWSKFIRKDFILENNIILPSNISYAEDVAMIATLFMHNPKISFERTPLYHYYQRTTSISNVLNPKVLEVDQAFKHIEEQLKLKNIYDKYEEEYQFFVYLHMIRYQLLGKYYQHSDLGQKLYYLYKKRNINIYKNSYFIQVNKNTDMYTRIRAKAYHHGYMLGKTIDNPRIAAKKMLRRQ